MSSTELLSIFHVLEKNEFNTGSVHQMFQAAAGMAARGHRVTIFSRPGADLAARAAAAGCDFVSLPLRNPFDLSSILAFRREVVARKPDVIHVHKGLSQSIALAATWFAPVSAFVVNRGVSFALNFWNRGKYRTSRVDRIVTVCQQIKDVIVATAGVSPEKVTVVYAGVDEADFDPSVQDGKDFRREKNISEDAFVFAQVGVRDWKGWRELIDAFVFVHQQHSSTRLMLIAYKSAAQAEEIRQYSLQRGAGDAVIPVEYRPDMSRVLAAADCVVDASWAGTGVTGTIREGMSLEKPVIATDCGGNNELLTSPEVGLLIQPRNQQQLTDAMLRVLERPAESSEMGKRARKHVVEGFSKKQRLDQLERIYFEIVKGRSQ